MKVRFVLILAITALLLALGGVAASCDGGGDELTLEEFFQAVEELDEQQEEASAALDAELDSITEDSSPDEVLDVIDQQADLIDEFIDGLEDLNAPDETADLQAEAVSAGREVANVVHDAVDEARGAESMAELEDFFALFETDQAVFDRFTQVCLNAEQMAADNGITVDYNCEDE